MSAIRGTQVAAPVVPFDTADTYSTHIDEYGRGGYRSVADIAERNGITDKRRKEGMIVRVIDEMVTYELVGGIANSNWQPYQSNAAALDPINDVLFGTGRMTGFLRGNPETMGVVEFSPNGTDIVRYNSDGTVDTNNSGNFDDGGANQVAAVARTMAIFPNSGETEFEVMLEAKKWKFTGLLSVEIPDDMGKNYVYIDETGVLCVDSAWNDTYFTKTPIVGYVYWNNDSGEVIDFTDARHGVEMIPAEKVRVFAIDGTNYVSGMEVVGLSAGGTTFTQVNSGKAYSADIVVKAIASSTVKTLYLYDTNSWGQKAATDDIGYIDGSAKWNKFDGTNYTLESLTSGKLMVVILALSGDNYGSYVRLLGQTEYANIDTARAGVTAELTKLSNVGLAGMNYLPVCAAVVDVDGKVVALDDGSLYVDLRSAKVTSSGAMSPVAVNHADLGGLDTESVHKSTSISYDNTVVGKLIAENVQAAIDETVRYSVKKAAGYAIALG